MYTVGPLRDRIFVAKPRGRLCFETSIDRPRYNQWDDVSMTKAMSAVEGGMSIRLASELYGVPKSSLHDRISGKVQHGTRPGPTPYLTSEEEEEFVIFLIHTADIGFPRTIAQVLALVQQLLDFKGIDKVCTHGWWQRFCQRHKEVSLRTAVPLAMVRAKATDIETFERYFDVLEDALKKNGMFNNPVRIYNCDETGVPLNPKGIKVIARRGAKGVSCVAGDTKSQITVLACTCASGVALPPMVIFDRKTLNPELTTGEVPGTIYGLSDKGWINRELFLNWFHRHFLALIPPTRPILLLMDGHSSHYSPDVIRAAAEEKIILFTLPPHTTHIAQPLDRGPFSPLKAYWKQICHDFYAKNTGRVVTRFDFSSLFSEAWKLAMTPKNILSGFNVTGVYPFNRERVKAQLVPQSTKPKSLAERTGLAYIPFYSPIHKRVCSKRGTTTTVARSATPESYDGEESSSLLERSLSESNLVGLRTKRATSITQFLKSPEHPNKLPTKNQKSAGKVLTSLENIEAMEEKQRKKDEELKKKEERKRLREAKARENREKKAAKARKKSIIYAHEC